MAGIYIIKGHHEGYVGLDSNASGEDSPRLIDHAAHSYGVVGKDIQGRASKATNINILNVQHCEKVMALKTPSAYHYFLNTEEHFGLDPQYYTLFNTIGKSQSKNAEEDGAEICYIYHYHSKNTNGSSLNSIGGGQHPFTCNFVKIMNLSIAGLKDSKLRSSLQKVIKGSARQDQGNIDQEHMNKLFYPELIIVDDLKKYCQARISKMVSKTFIKDCIINHYKQEDIINIMQKKCDEIMHDCNIILERLSHLSTSVIKKSTAKCICTVNIAGVKEFQKLLTDPILAGIQKKNNKISNNFMQMHKDVTLITYNINIELLSHRTLPKGFPAQGEFNINKFQDVTNVIKHRMIDYLDIIYSIFEKANENLNGDIHRTATYMDSLSTDIYKGILSQTTFSEYYNNLMNYGLNKRDGPLVVMGQIDDNFIVRRSGGQVDSYTHVPEQYLANTLSDQADFNQITVG